MKNLKEKKKIFLFRYQSNEKIRIYHTRFLDKLYDFIFGPTYQYVPRIESWLLNEDGHIYCGCLSGNSGHLITRMRIKMGEENEKKEIYEFSDNTSSDDPLLIDAIKKIKDETLRTQILSHTV